MQIQAENLWNVLYKNAPIFGIHFSLLASFTILFLNYWSIGSVSKILTKYFLFEKVPKMSKDITKFLTKARNENSTIKLVFKCFTTFFLKLTLFDVSAGQNKIFTVPKDVFSYRNPFDSCLFMKNWNPRKRVTLMYSKVQDDYVTKIIFVNAAVPIHSSGT